MSSQDGAAAGVEANGPYFNLRVAEVIDETHDSRSIVLDVPAELDDRFVYHDAETAGCFLEHSADFGHTCSRSDRFRHGRQKARGNQVRAFINACRHRGMQVASGSGSARVFACPYHAWTYSLVGAW